jgi:hypothetical protein
METSSSYHSLVENQRLMTAKFFQDNKIIKRAALNIYRAAHQSNQFATTSVFALENK